MMEKAKSMALQELVKESVDKFLLYENLRKMKGVKWGIFLVMSISLLYSITEQKAFLFLFIPLTVYLFFLFFPGERKVILPEKFLSLAESPFFYIKKEKGVYVPIQFSARKHVPLEVDKETIKNFKDGYDSLLSFDKKGEIEWKKSTS